MKIAVVGISCWERDAASVLDLAARIAAQAKTGSVVLLDRQSVQRNRQASAPQVPHVLHEVRDWIDGYVMQRAEIDVKAVRARCTQICASDGVQVIDVGCFDLDVLARVVEQMRLAMFHQERWPAILLFVVDDFMVHQAMEMVARAFFIQPAVSDTTATQKLADELIFQARLSMILGFFLHRIRQRLRRLLGGDVRRARQTHLEKQ